MLKITTILLVVSMLAVPVHAQPIINQTGTQADDAELVVTGQVQGVNQIFMPLVMSPCASITPLTPVAAGTTFQCVQPSSYTGTQGPSNLIATVTTGRASLSSSTLPHFAVSIPVTGTHIGPQSTVDLSSLVVSIHTMSFMTTTTAVRAAATYDAPFAGRIAWTFTNALQDEAIDLPTLFPVPITVLHYSQPRVASQIATIFERCAAVLNGAQLALPGFPYDMTIDDAMTRGGNVWLRMKYPSCPAISGYYIKLSSFWQGLKVFAEYQTIEAEAAALVAPGTYHVSDLALRMPDGQVALVAATIIVFAIGALVVIVILPEVGVGWWLLTGAAAVKEER